MDQVQAVTLCRVGGEFCVCRLPALPDMSKIEAPYFTGVTHSEISLVCADSCAPPDAQRIERGFALLGIRGQLDFALIGILAGITGALKDAGISVFAISTFDTDYIMVRADMLDKAAFALRGAGYGVIV